MKRLVFEEVPMEVNETYVDNDGMIRERKRTIMVPTGNVIEVDDDVPDAQNEQKPPAEESDT